MHNSGSTNLKDAVNYAKDFGITITVDKTKTVLTNEDQKTIEVQQESPKHMSDIFTQAKNGIYMKETIEQKWLGAFTTAQSSINIYIVNAANQFSIRNGNPYLTARQLSFNERSFYFYLNST